MPRLLTAVTLALGLMLSAEHAAPAPLSLELAELSALAFSSEGTSAEDIGAALMATPAQRRWVRVRGVPREPAPDRRVDWRLPIGARPLPGSEQDRSHNPARDPRQPLTRWAAPAVPRVWVVRPSLEPPRRLPRALLRICADVPTDFDGQALSLSGRVQVRDAAGHWQGRERPFAGLLLDPTDLHARDLGQLESAYGANPVGCASLLVPVPELGAQYPGRPLLSPRATVELKLQASGGARWRYAPQEIEALEEQ